MVYAEFFWYITDDTLQPYVCYKKYLKLESEGILKCTCSKNRIILEKNPLKLETKWYEGINHSRESNWFETATVKIFSTKEEYENYQLETIKQKKMET